MKHRFKSVLPICQLSFAVTRAGELAVTVIPSTHYPFVLTGYGEQIFQRRVSRFFRRSSGGRR